MCIDHRHCRQDRLPQKFARRQDNANLTVITFDRHTRDLEHRGRCKTQRHPNETQMLQHANTPFKYAPAASPKARRLPRPMPHEPGYDTVERLIQTLVLTRLDAIAADIKLIEARASNDDSYQPRAIRLPEVLNILGISKSALYDWLSPNSSSHDPALPRPFKLGKSDRSPSAWWHHEVVAYLKSLADLQRNN